MYPRTFSVKKRPKEKVNAKGMMPQRPDIPRAVGMASSGRSEKKAKKIVYRRTQQANQINGPNLFQRVLGAHIPVITPPIRPAEKGVKVRAAIPDDSACAGKAKQSSTTTAVTGNIERRLQEGIL